MQQTTKIMMIHFFTDALLSPIPAYLNLRRRHQIASSSPPPYYLAVITVTCCHCEEGIVNCIEREKDAAQLSTCC